MIKARVSKNLRGTIMLPTISPVAIGANKEVLMTEDQFMAADIQGALTKKLLIMIDGPSQKGVTFSKVTNLSFGSVTLPKVGVLRAGKTLDVRSDIIDTPLYRQMIKDKLIAIDLKLKTGKLDETDIKSKKSSKYQEDDDIVIPPNMQKGKPITVHQEVDDDGLGKTKTVINDSSKKKPKVKARHKAKEENLIFDPNSDEVEEAEDFLIDPRTGKRVVETDNIIFVDHEQSQARMNPKLAKLKAKGKQK